MEFWILTAVPPCGSFAGGRLLGSTDSMPFRVSKMIKQQVWVQR